LDIKVLKSTVLIIEAAKISIPPKISFEVGTSLKSKNPRMETKNSSVARITVPTFTSNVENHIKEDFQVQFEVKQKRLLQPSIAEVLLLKLLRLKVTSLRLQKES